MDNFGLCVIATRPQVGYTELAKICVRQGIKYLQLREKHLTDRELIRAGEEILSITKGTQTQFVVNDRADIAFAIGADMLHLGQDDMPIEFARSIVGNMPIGLSTHSIEQAHRALAHSPAYIGFGPIYATTTKAMPDPVVGAELLAKVLSFADVPVIAIGGIFPENIDTVIAAGARNVSLVRYLMETTDTEQRIAELRQKLL